MEEAREGMAVEAICWPRDRRSSFAEGGKSEVLIEYVPVRRDE